MRRHHLIIGAIAVVGLAGCGTGGTVNPEPTAITAPAAKARSTVDQQNAQLKQMEQQTSSADPTVAP